jgi:hypothetical protein
MQLRSHERRCRLSILAGPLWLKNPKFEFRNPKQTSENAEILKTRFVEKASDQLSASERRFGLPHSVRNDMAFQQSHLK